MSRMSSSGYRETPVSRCTCFWKCIVPVTRFWGVATSVVLGGVGADHVAHRYVLGIYFIVAAFGIFFLEITWAITLFLQLCIRDIDEGCGVRCWSAVLWVSCWKKSLIYGTLSVIPLLYPLNLWLSYLVGGQLVVLSVLHLILTFRRRYRNKDRLLQQYGDADSIDSCRFEEVLDDTLPEVIPERHSLSGGIHEDQDLILEI